LRSLTIFLAISAAACLSGGCGYHLTGTMENPSLIAGKTIAIPMWRSKTFRPHMETMLTKSLVDEFALRTGGLVVKEENADLVLTGTINSYTEGAISFTSADQVREYRATMKVDATLTEKRSQKVLWRGVVSSSQDYPASIDVNAPNTIALQQDSQEGAIKEICRKLAEQIYLKVTENF